MKQILSNGKDLTELVEKITWSGDTKQVARTLVFTIASKDSDPYLPNVEISEGDEVLFVDDDTTLFGGIIFDVEKASSSDLVTYTSFDLLYYINQSDISHVFNATPENIAAQVCSDLGIPFGSAAVTGINVYFPCLGKKAYEAIMAAYTEASRQNGKKYIPLMKHVNQLCVMEKGAWSGVVLDGEYNLTGANYKTSLQKMVNKVLITDKNGNLISSVQDTELQSRYGVVQRVYKQEEGKYAEAAARSLLCGIEQSGSVTALGDVRAVSGYSVAVQEPASGLYGLFYIESDTHTFSNGNHEMQLTLAFSNVMDEKGIEQNKVKQ